MLNRKQKKIVLITLVSVLLLLVPQIIIAFSSGAPNGRTGAPGEGLCSDCHGSAVGDGSIALSGVPANYDLNQSYTLTVTLEDQGQSRWGFELTAVDGSNNGAGSFTITDAVNTQLSDSPPPSKDYVKQTNTGTYNGTVNGPVTWNFDWQAPSSNIGAIAFYVAGNAANGNGSTSGDFIYTTSETTQPPAQTCQGICGDANDDTDVNVSDAVKIINYVFVGGDAPVPLACGDANNDGDVNVSDAVRIINYVFVGGDPPGDCSPGSVNWIDGDCCPFVP